MTTSGTATPETCKECAAPRKELRAYDADVVDYLNAAQSAFHCVAEVTARLTKAGFEVLDERKAWTVQPNGKYIVTRNGSSLCAFAVGGKFNNETSGAICVGAHTDSPCPKLKPVSRLE
jgi:aspartyl aminopeptidase